MTVYFQGAEASDFILTGVSAGNMGSTAGRFNSANSRGYMSFTVSIADDTQYIESDNFVATDFWSHQSFYGAVSAGGTASYFYKIFDQAGVDRIRIKRISSTSIGLDYWNGSAWVSIGTYTVSFDSVRHVYDLYVLLGNPGQVRLYVDGIAAIYTTSLDTTFGGATTSFKKGRWGPVGTGATNSSAHSECIIADWNTIGSKLVTRIPNAAGTYSEWTGAGYTAVDELIPSSDFMLSGTANQRFSVSYSSFPTEATGESVESLKIAAWINKDAGGPQNANFFTRVSATDYNLSDQAVPTVQSPLYNSWAQNPNTSAAWTAAILNGAEFGIRSRT